MKLIFGVVDRALAHARANGRRKQILPNFTCSRRRKQDTQAVCNGRIDGGGEIAGARADDNHRIGHRGLKWLLLAVHGRAPEYEFRYSVVGCWSRRFRERFAPMRLPFCRNPFIMMMKSTMMMCAICIADGLAEQVLKKKDCPVGIRLPRSSCGRTTPTPPSPNQ